MVSAVYVSQDTNWFKELGKDILKVITKPFEALGKSAREEIYDKVGWLLGNIGKLLYEGLVYLMPDIVGLGAFFAGGWIMYNSMAGKTIIKPIGIYFAVLIFGTALVIA